MKSPMKQTLRCIVDKLFFSGHNEGGDIPWSQDRLNN